ncbi:MAG TPA: GerMN domain-containing protein [Firmicutes bacterium]|nr:GerMN domain-containing protein [Bacillota bacterium]
MKQITNLSKEAFRLALIWVAIGLVAGLTVGGLWAHRYYRQAKKYNSRLVTTKAQLEGLQEKESHLAVLYFIKETGAESYLVPERRKIPYNGNPQLAAVQELFNGPESPDLQAVFSRKTKVLKLEIQDGLATIDLNKEATKSSRGAWGEALTVSALVNTLTKFPEVDQVRILIEGKEVETLSGHVDLSRPLRRNEQVIRLPDGR